MTLPLESLKPLKLQRNGTIDTRGTAMMLTGTAEVSWNGLDVERAFGLP
jgi:hypothetical protein